MPCKAAALFIGPISTLAGISPEESCLEGTGETLHNKNPRGSILKRTIPSQWLLKLGYHLPDK